MIIMKRPNPSNFTSGKVCLNHTEVDSIRVGDTLTILKYNSSDVYASMKVTQEMIDSIEIKNEEYALMRYRFKSI